jgi:hypothetical protein
LILNLVADYSKSKNTHTAERSGAARPADRDLIHVNKAVDLFPRIKSQAAGRSAPLYVCFYTKTFFVDLNVDYAN